MKRISPIRQTPSSLASVVLHVRVALTEALIAASDVAALDRCPCNRADDIFGRSFAANYINACSATPKEIPVCERVAPGEGFEPSVSSSKPDVFPFTPSQKVTSGHWDSNPEPCADLALTPLIRRLLYQLSYAPIWLVAAAGVEPAFLDYQSSVLPLDYTAIGCGGRTRTFECRINNPMPYQLGYATK